MQLLFPKVATILRVSNEMHTSPALPESVAGRIAAIVSSLCHLEPEDDGARWHESQKLASDGILFTEVLEPSQQWIPDLWVNWLRSGVRRVSSHPHQ